MNEKMKWIIVFSIFVMLAFIVCAVGARVTSYIYETTPSFKQWMECVSCYGEYFCGASPMPLWKSLLVFVVNLTSIILAMFLVFTGASYYKCGRFMCPDVFLEEKEEYNEVEGWGE
ncbi:MAG: hypothetical protein JHC26_09640 [Thermofilum sp.]|uniref:hypothetical protein n=1 Tax=Thermofilum sp. TaxID=1961369 RepID=UPI002586254A|nr:hypothetical protein [Thermofilum sp.]MCI4409343.1 hypothetical protein [Thermofilum sp.]